MRRCTSALSLSLSLSLWRCSLTPRTSRTSLRVRWRADDDDGGSTSLSDGPKAKRNNIVSPLPIAFEDNSSNIATQFMYSQPLPQHPRYYCFFLTNIVAGTLRRGGFMTESVYVPRVIWFVHTPVDSRTHSYGSLTTSRSRLHATQATNGRRDTCAASQGRVVQVPDARLPQQDRSAVVRRARARAEGARAHRHRPRHRAELPRREPRVGAQDQARPGSSADRCSRSSIHIARV